MKAIFDPKEDTFNDVLQFVEFCYERGLSLHISTLGAPKRRSPRRRQKAEQVPNDDNLGFDIENVAQQVSNGPVEETQHKTVANKRWGRKAGRLAKKRAPHIDKQMYDRIKAGDADAIQLYAPHTVGVVNRSKSWNAFRALKAKLAKTARDQKATQKRRASSSTDWND